MKTEPEHRPFLGYSDDPAASGDGNEAGRTAPAAAATNAALQAPLRTRRVARDIAVFLVASLLWLAVIVIFMPRAATTSIAPAPPTTTTTTTSTSAAPPKVHHGSGSGGSFGGSGAGAGGLDGGSYRWHNVTSKARFVACGNSTAEARASGCKYDPLLNHWVPMQCLDREWIDEYKDDGSWTAFVDANLTQPIRAEDMGSMEHYYTSIRDHVNHCAMLWRKQFWTLFESRKVFDAVIVNTYHTEHCAEFMANLYGMNRTEPTLVRVGFSGCWVQNEVEL